MIVMYWECAPELGWYPSCIIVVAYFCTWHCLLGQCMEGNSLMKRVKSSYVLGCVKRSLGSSVKYGNKASQQILDDGPTNKSLRSCLVPRPHPQGGKRVWWISSTFLGFPESCDAHSKHMIVHGLGLIDWALSHDYYTICHMKAF